MSRTKPVSLKKYTGSGVLVSLWKSSGDDLQCVRQQCG